MKGLVRYQQRGCFRFLTFSWQVAHSSRNWELCPVHRGPIAMSGSSHKVAGGLRWQHALWPEAVPESGSSSLRHIQLFSPASVP
jgi:hypothetical protein